jgi:hypothetical protein
MAEAACTLMVSLNKEKNKGTDDGKAGDERNDDGGSMETARFSFFVGLPWS